MLYLSPFAAGFQTLPIYHLRIAWPYSELLAISLIVHCITTTSYNSSIKTIEKAIHIKIVAEELHAELCYAESLLFCSILTFFHDESLSSFVRGALKIRACYQSYRLVEFFLTTYRFFVDSLIWHTFGFNYRRTFAI